MPNWVFLLAAFGLIVLGVAVLLLRHRTPSGLDHGIREFQREMQALAPEQRRTVRPPDPSSPRRGRRSD